MCIRDRNLVAGTLTSAADRDARVRGAVETAISWQHCVSTAASVCIAVSTAPRTRASRSAADVSVPATKFFESVTSCRTIVDSWLAAAPGGGGGGGVVGTCEPRRSRCNAAVIASMSPIASWHANWPYVLFATDSITSYGPRPCYTPQRSHEIDRYVVRLQQTITLLLAVRQF